jgi:P pilus assembly chaperone PapD
MQEKRNDKTITITKNARNPISKKKWNEMKENLEQQNPLIFFTPLVTLQSISTEQLVICSVGTGFFSISIRG